MEKDKLSTNPGVGSAANIVAKEALTKPPEPGIHRQPIGPVGLLKLKQKEREEKEHENTAIGKKESALDTSRALSIMDPGSDRLTENRRSTLLQSDDGSSSSLIPGKDHTSNIGVVESTTSAEGDSGLDGSQEEENWDLFVQDEEEFNAIDLDDNDEQPVYDMAVVEIDVNEEHENMELTLKKMLSDARTTHREKTILMDKFNLLLQALVSFQESEVELIDHLRTKMSIMDVLKVFITNEVQVATNMSRAEEEETPEEVGILGAFSVDTEKVKDPGYADDAEDEGVRGGPHDGGKTFKNMQGISIDEMAATTIRETLLIQKNKLEMQESMKVVHLLELKQLEFEKTLLMMHYSKMVKPSDLQREMKELRKTVNDLQMEVVVTQQEIVQIQNETNVQDKLLRDDEARVETMETDLMSKQLSIQQNANKPLRLAREAERADFELEQLRDHYDALCERWMEGMEAVNLIQDTIYSKQQELQELIKEINKMQHSRKLSIAETDTLTLQLEALNKKEHNLLEKQSTIVERIATVIRERKQFQDDLHKIHNKCTKSSHELSHLEHSLHIASDSHINAKLAYDKMKSAFDSIKPQETSSSWNKLSKMFHREIMILKTSLSKKLEESTYAASNVDRLQAKLNELYNEQVDAGKELQDLIRTTVRKRHERQEKSEQCIKLEAQAARLIADKKMRQLILDECGRSERELYRSMEAVRKAYNKVKIERASLTNDLIQTRQKLTEQSEKFKICNNEIESYNNQIMDRVKEIQRVHYINLNAGLRRDSVKNEALRVIDKCRIAKKERDELSLTNSTNRKEINRQKAEIAEIRNNFETAIHASNKIAIKVRERVEEVCTFIEKIKAYELIILKGTAELNIREIEKIKLESILEEVKKHLLIVMTNQPDEGLLFEEIQTLRNQFYEITEQRRATEIELNDITNKSRIREIHHELITKRETVPLLESKVRLLEENLATRDCLSLERELILKQIDELTEESMEKANYLKATYADEVKELVSLRKSLYNIATQIDGMICETSIAAAQADSSEKTFNELSKQFLEAEQKFYAGCAPTEEMEQEFQRILWREEMLRRSNEHQAQLRLNRIVRKTDIKSGSQIVMERLRPKKKPCTRTKEEWMEADRIPLPLNFATKKCDARASRNYKPSKWAKKLAKGKKCFYPHDNNTGLPYCH